MTEEDRLDLVARAPQPPPEWFDVKMPPRPSVNNYGGRSEGVEEAAQWDHQNDLERCLQWPFFWADCILCRSEGKILPLENAKSPRTGKMTWRWAE